LITKNTLFFTLQKRISQKKFFFLQNYIFLPKNETDDNTTICCINWDACF